MSLSSLNGSEAAALASVLQEPAEKFGNDATVELLWAMKAHQHAQIYYNLLQATSPPSLRLTKIDDDIYRLFRSQFPELNIMMLNVDGIKSDSGKQEWREFCNQFEGKVEDWNMATLLRIDATGDVSDGNTVIVPRIQFLAIEVARNREHCNDAVQTFQQRT
jgi:hypothetical protein